jgi:hypothetical protein
MKTSFRAFTEASFLILSSVAGVFANCTPDIGCYGALVAGTWVDEDGIGQASVGASWNNANGSSSIDAALLQCRRKAEKCQILDTFA